MGWRSGGSGSIISSVRALVLGGGVAGLAAALELRRRRPELELTLIEARGRLGGRVWTERDPDDGLPIERGAEFVHGRPKALLAELRRAGIDVAEDRSDFWIGSGRRAGPGGAETGRAFGALGKALAGLLDPKARDRSIAALADEPPLSELPPELRAIARSFAEGYYLAKPERASARAIARMEAAQDAIGGDGSSRPAGGYGRLIEWLGARIGAERILRGAAARRLDWRSGHVRVLVDGLGGRLPELEADRAIIALPLSSIAGERSLGGRLGIRPPVREKLEAARSLEMGNVVKLQLRLRGRLGGGSFSLAPGQPVPTWWHASPPGSPWVVGWAGGPAADALDPLDDDLLRDVALASLAVAWGEPRRSLARRLEAFLATRWGRDPLSFGGYAWVPLGADGAMEALAAPVAETLFFAGEATEPGHAGTVHGAYESGVRAAGELIATLPKRRRR